MNIEKYKSDYLDKRMQLILFYKETGKIIYSTETLFTVLTYDSIYALNPFVESIAPVLESLQLNNPLTFSCVNSEVDGSKVFYDYQFEVPSEKEDDLIVMQVFNFSDHYENLTRMQQERNDLEILQEVQQVEQEKIRIENELLTFQNNELERVQKLKTDFFARVSHEIRNPVSGIAGLTELLGKNYNNSNKAQEYLEALSSTSQHLANLVNNVLEFSRLEVTEEDLDVEKISFDCYSLLKSIINTFLFSAKEKGIKLKLRFNPEIPSPLQGDKYKLTQILTNLIGNAVKFTEEGKVKVAVDIDKEEESHITLIFQVKDTGIGIPEHKLDKIFEPYIQADKSVKRIYGGTGLGLPIVEQLIGQMGGTIEVKSEIGKGSVFTLQLPFESQASEIEVTPNERRFFDGKVLIGEDDPINRKVLGAVLEHEGISYDTAENGREALKLHQSNSYDLFILDVDMPWINGIEVSKEIRKSSQTPIIICSGKPVSEVEGELSAYNNIAFVNKPVSSQTLFEIIAKIVKSGEKKIIDFEVFENLFGENREKILEIISIFIEEAPENVEKMKQYFLNNELDQLKRVAHKAKSGYAYFGMKSTCRLCDELEKDLENNLEKNYLPQIEKIEQDTLSAIEELNQ